MWSLPFEFQAAHYYEMKNAGVQLIKVEDGRIGVL